MRWDYDSRSGKWTLYVPDPDYPNWRQQAGEVFPPSTPFLDGFGKGKWKGRLYYQRDRRAFDTLEEAKAWVAAVVALEEDEP